MKVTDFKEVKKDYEMICSRVRAIKSANEALGRLKNLNLDSIEELRLIQQLMGEKPLNVYTLDLAAKFLEVKKSLLKDFIAEQTEKLNAIDWKVTVGEEQAK